MTRQTRRLRLALLVLLVLSPASAWAGVNDVVTAVTVTITSGNCIAFNQFRNTLTIDNTSASGVNVGYCETATSSSTACTATLGSGGTTTLATGSLHYWPWLSAPKNQICFIAASSTQAITVREGQ